MLQSLDSQLMQLSSLLVVFVSHGDHLIISVVGKEEYGSTNPLELLKRHENGMWPDLVLIFG